MSLKTWLRSTFSNLNLNFYWILRKFETETITFLPVVQMHLWSRNITNKWMAKWNEEEKKRLWWRDRMIFSLPDCCDFNLQPKSRYSHFRLNCCLCTSSWTINNRISSQSPTFQYSNERKHMRSVVQTTRGIRVFGALRNRRAHRSYVRFVKKPKKWR